jgi:hypothetical protein
MAQIAIVHFQLTLSLPKYFEKWSLAGPKKWIQDLFFDTDSQGCPEKTWFSFTIVFHGYYSMKKCGIQ